MKNVNYRAFLVIGVLLAVITACGMGDGSSSGQPCPPPPPPPDISGLWYGTGYFVTSNLSSYRSSYSIKIAFDITQAGRDNFSVAVEDLISDRDPFFHTADDQLDFWGYFKDPCSTNPEYEEIVFLWQTSENVTCCKYVGSGNLGRTYCRTFPFEGYILKGDYYGNGYLKLHGYYRYSCASSVSLLFSPYFWLYYGDIYLRKLSFLYPTLPDSGQNESYTTTWGEDSDFLINNQSFTDNYNSTVTDGITGLMWQQGDSEIPMSFSHAAWYCNNLALASHYDWRLPNRKELVSLVDYGHYGDAINHSYFPPKGSDYWTNSRFWSTTGEARYVSSVVSIKSGEVKIEATDDGFQNMAKCVRGIEIEEQTLFDKRDGTIIDVSTGLFWQKYPTATTMDFENAIAYCTSLELGGHADWRLPNIKELDSIVLYTQNKGEKIDSMYFPNTTAQSNEYKSSTTFAKSGHEHIGLTIGFGSGQGWIGTGSLKTNAASVRCVRNR